MAIACVAFAGGGFALLSFNGCDQADKPAVTPPSAVTAPKASVSAIGPGSLGGVALFTGAAIPAMAEIEVKTDVAHCGNKVKTENRIVNATNRGLKNVVVTVEGVEGGKAAEPTTITVANKGCSFVPHVSACVRKSKLRVTNDDPINHTTHPYYGSTTVFNVSLGPNDERVRPLRRKGVVRLRCDVHDWMTGWVVVHDNPYFAVTDDSGKFEIGDVPAGTYTVNAWHEDLGTATAQVTVEPGKAASYKFEFNESGASAAPAEAVSQAEVIDDAESPLPGRKLPLGLDPYEAKVPADNPVTVEKVALGKVLYFDKRLSKDDTISCASCHAPAKGYSNGEAFATGVRGQVGGRAAPTIVNRLFSTLQFWDGRSPSVEDQALGPIQNPIEMDMTLPAVVEKLKKISGYAELFEKAFGTPEITDVRIARAIASFERTVVSGNSPFDRFEAGDASALTLSQKRGLALFRGKAKCSVCHTGFNLTDEKYHNIGVGMDKPDPDVGRFSQTKKEEDKGAFKTPTLRDIVHTAPYFHDGRSKTLEEVVDFYDQGGVANPTLSKNIFKLNLTEQEKKDLVEIMKAFTGDDRTVSDVPDLPGT